MKNSVAIDSDLCNTTTLILYSCWFCVPPHKLKTSWKQIVQLEIAKNKFSLKMNFQLLLSESLQQISFENFCNFYAWFIQNLSNWIFGITLTFILKSCWFCVQHHNPKTRWTHIAILEVVRKNFFQDI